MSAFYIAAIRQRRRELKENGYEQYLNGILQQEQQRLKKERMEKLAAAAMKVQENVQCSEGLFQQQDEVEVSKSSCKAGVPGKRKRK